MIELPGFPFRSLEMAFVLQVGSSARGASGWTVATQAQKACDRSGGAAASATVRPSSVATRCVVGGTMTRVMRADVRVFQEKKDGGEAGAGAEEEDQPERPQTLKGVIIFTVTMGLFALGLAATFGRAMLPGGLAPPIQ
ncbi:hypothetical protein FVE85_3697 [Porphyridium purpureum]|uniref:Uncharacterized protein n=1 Tax=Porphyridium purpureum TaxID=35688 RepID=A0A5J4YLA7_PORPP|nr:hypothetical protein FVE85_3697 [Porphyridium purpureum]|eukprot:POR0603..scf249_10